MNEQITLALGEALTVPRDGTYDYPAIRAHIADAIIYVCRGWDQTHEGWRDAALDELAERIAVYLVAAIGTAIDRDVYRLGENVAHRLIAEHDVPCRCHPRADRLEAEHGS